MTQRKTCERQTERERERKVDNFLQQIHMTEREKPIDKYQDRETVRYMYKLETYEGKWQRQNSAGGGGGGGESNGIKKEAGRQSYRSKKGQPDRQIDRQSR